MAEEVIRIGIVGTESTGKSALAAALAEHFDDPWAPEFVRAFWDERRGRIEASDLPTIARGQIANEETAVLAARRIVFCDTTLLMNVRWADDLYGGDIPDWMREAADARSGQYALHLYCEADLPWEPDPQRTFADPADWRASAQRVKRMIESRHLPFVSVTGQGRDRFEQALQAVEQILPSID